MHELNGLPQFVVARVCWAINQLCSCALVMCSWCTNVGICCCLFCADTMWTAYHLHVAGIVYCTRCSVHVCTALRCISHPRSIEYKAKNKVHWCQPVNLLFSASVFVPLWPCSVEHKPENKVHLSYSVNLPISSSVLVPLTVCVQISSCGTHSWCLVLVFLPFTQMKALHPTAVSFAFPTFV